MRSANGVPATSSVPLITIARTGGAAVAMGAAIVAAIAASPAAASREFRVMPCVSCPPSGLEPAVFDRHEG